MVGERVADSCLRFKPADPRDRVVSFPGKQMQCDLWSPPAEGPIRVEPAGFPDVGSDGGIFLPVRWWNLVAVYFDR